MPHQRADLSHPGEPDVDSTIILDFSATATTDQGRVRSVDHPHPWPSRAVVRGHCYSVPHGDDRGCGLARLNIVRPNSTSASYFTASISNLQHGQILPSGPAAG
jgi:hypothetical protein